MNHKEMEKAEAGEEKNVQSRAPPLRAAAIYWPLSHDSQSVARSGQI